MRPTLTIFQPRESFGVERNPGLLRDTRPHNLANETRQGGVFNLDLECFREQTQFVDTTQTTLFKAFSFLARVPRREIYSVEVSDGFGHFLGNGDSFCADRGAATKSESWRTHGREKRIMFTAYEASSPAPLPGLFSPAQKRFTFSGTVGSVKRV